jgi:uncharacterized protein (DUF433 family)
MKSVYMPNLLERITINPKQCGGRPCIRGMRIRVSDVLDLFASSHPQINSKLRAIAALAVGIAYTRK